jgi:hypothetical protein
MMTESLRVQLVLGGLLWLMGTAILLLNRYLATHPNFWLRFLRLGHEQTSEGRSPGNAIAFWVGAVLMVGGCAVVVLSALRISL